jgi:predicted acylesterase/phospholipase RssA
VAGVEELAGKSTGIAVSLSGGGVRAMLFGLGALRAVVQAAQGGDKITTVATVSGGSIGAAFAFARLRPTGFNLSADEYDEKVLGPAYRAITTRSMMWGVWPFWVVVAIVSLLLACVVGFLTPHSLAAEIGVPLVTGGLLALALLRYFTKDFGLRREALQGLVLAMAFGLVVAGVAFADAALWLRGAGSVVALAAALLIARLRGSALEYGMQKALFSARDGVIAPLLRDVGFDTRLAITATNLNSGEALYLMPDRIQSWAWGKADTGDLRLVTAARASATFPGVFPALLLPHREFTEGNLELKPPARLALVDGGLYDNMGTEWLIGHTSFKDYLVVVNASKNLQPTRGSFSFPILSELAVLGRNQSIQYDASTAPRRRWLVSMFMESSRTGRVNKESRRGTIVKIEGPVTAWLQSFANARIDDGRKQRAASMLAALGQFAPDTAWWEKTAKANAAVATSLDRLPAKTARDLISLGYLTTMIQLHVLENWPKPDVADFRRLVDSVLEGRSAG